MAKTKISEFSATANSNTDINSINIAEGCAPSNINDAIRELMAELKDFQAGTKGDSFNGPVGTTTAAAGAFTTLSASSTVSGTGFSTYLASPPAIGGTAPAAGAFTTLSSTGNTTLGDASGDTVTINGTTTFANVNPTLSAGTANGVLYLNGSKVATSGSALTFDGTVLANKNNITALSGTNSSDIYFAVGNSVSGSNSGFFGWRYNSGSPYVYLEPYAQGIPARLGGSEIQFQIANGEQMRLTSTGLGIGTSSPATKLDVNGSINLSSVGNLTWGGAYGAGIPTIAVPSAGSLGFYPNGSTSGLSMVLNSSGNLGIGTSSPSAQLQLNKSGTSDYTTFRLSNSGASGKTYEIGVGGNASAAGYANNLYFYDSTAGSLRMVLDTSGNLGLGVTPSAWTSTFKALQIGAGLSLYDNGIGSGTFLGANYYYNGTNNIYKNTAAATAYSQSAGVHAWYNAPSGTAGNAITFTQAMTLDASGNLIVGGTSALVSTSGRGNITINGTSESILAFGIGGTNSGYVYSNSSSLIFNAQGSRVVAFEAGGTERARIDSSGNLLINKTTATTTGAGGYILASGQVSGTRDGGAAGAFRRDTSDGDVVIFLRGGTQVGSVSVTATATAYNTSSDYRLKENIQPMTGSLAKVQALKPCTYNWKADGSAGEGFIAHELAEVVPQAVTGEKDAVDEEGNPVYQGIDTSFLVATLTAALQEAVAEINSLKARLDAANL